MSDFFEDLGKRLSEVADDIGRKAGDTLEVEKHKSQIRSLKRANERDFIEIGHMVYDKFRSGEVSDLDYTALCEAIEKRDEEIVGHEEEIQRIKEVL